MDQYQAFVTAVDEGSFSAAARVLRKAQSAVSTAINNLEIELDVELFDRTSRHPTLTQVGAALLPRARSILLSSHELAAHAATLSEGQETRLAIAIEQGIVFRPLMDILREFGRELPFVEVELLEPGRNDVADLLKSGRADIGLMMEQEDYVKGMFFRGIGYSRLIPVCAQDHPLATKDQVSYADLRESRQILTRSRAADDTSHLREQKSAMPWYSESPYLIVELVARGLGWALLPQTVVRELLEAGTIVQMKYDFQQSDILQGIDVVWTERRPLGPAGRWLIDRLLTLKSDIWIG